MQRFDVDDDLVQLIWERAKPKPFETLTFNAALRRVLQSLTTAQGLTNSRSKDSLEEFFAQAKAAAAAMPKKASSPSASEWAATVPELRARKGLSTWKAICNVLDIAPAGDSARRKLKVWVRSNRPGWPEVPDA